MRTAPNCRPWLLASLLAAACGGAHIEGVVEATGGEVCTPDKTVCLSVQSGGIEKQELFRLTSSSEGPAGALSPTWDIGAVRAKSFTFLKPATVTFSLDLVDASVPNDSLLRIYTREDGDWVPLASPALDRVRGRVSGQVMHLSPFVILRTDRLSDGGIPVEIDGGTRDAAVILPPFDAGSLPRDGGPVDAGRPDAGRPDAGTPDAGTPDAGTPDAGTPDAGAPDAGPPDSGVRDAGLPDAGPPDAGPPDAGPPDAGPPDAGPPDSGADDAGVDAGLPDAGDGG